ncbi:glycosyltransferase family 61 protein [Okeania sp.]|uniref:glycosyltransferase family 61 protein n=1 Tax=Okeania sp. TaxID=3100323 RepID=UPI002B4B096D|nr:glycosyltransferase family 61 protein [Okeania sp.]MEB3340128.1 glycosyltransferase family 61 protein [Okeania sp.]
MKRKIVSDAYSWGYESPIGISQDIDNTISILGYYKNEPFHYCDTYECCSISFEDDCNFWIDESSTQAQNHISGSVGVLASQLAGTNNYFHWMIDCVSRIKALGNLEELDYIIFPKINSKYGQKVISALGINEAQVLIAEPGMMLSAERLSIPSERRTGNHQVSQWMVEFLRNSFLAKIEKNSEEEKRIYISRKSRGLRAIENAAEVELILKKYGFITYEFEKIAFDSQVKLMPNASFVLAPHGAGLTNLAFCNPKTKVLEIFAPCYISSLFYQIAKHVGCEYRFLVGNFSERDERNSNSRNIQVDTNDLSQLIENLLLV